MKGYARTSAHIICNDVELFSTIFTGTSLYVQGRFMYSLQFTAHSKFGFGIVILSISSAIGQLFVFYTISVFGGVVFTNVMNLHEAAAILAMDILLLVLL